MPTRRVASQAQRQEQAERLALCERVETLAGDDVALGLATARAEWEGLPPMAETWAADVQRRFDDAARAAERRHAQLEQGRQLAAQAPAVVEEAEGLVAADYATVRGQWQALRRKWQAIGRVGEVDPALAERFAAVMATFDGARAGRARRQATQPGGQPAPPAGWSCRGWRRGRRPRTCR